MDIAPEAVYATDDHGNVLARCEWCRAWERLSFQRPIKVGRFVEVEVETPEGIELVWMPRIKQVMGCTACQDLYWWEIKQTNARAKAQGRTLTAFVTTQSRQHRAEAESREQRIAQILRLLEGR